MILTVLSHNGGKKEQMAKHVKTDVEITGEFDIAIPSYQRVP